MTALSLAKPHKAVLGINATRTGFEKDRHRRQQLHRDGRRSDPERARGEERQGRRPSADQEQERQPRARLAIPMQ